MPDIIPIAKHDWIGPAYQSLLPPHASCRFHPDSVEFLSYAAIDQGQPVALLVARPILRGYELEHLFVLPSHRQQGLARRMTDLLVDTITKQEELLLIGYIPSDNPSAPIFERLATGPGWFPPQPFIERYHHDVYALNPPWFDRIPPLPKGFEEFPWSELKPEEETLIAHRGKQGAIPMSVIPVHRDKQRIEYSNSLGLRYEGEVVGWMITHRVDDDVIRYSGLYIAPHLRHRGLSIRLVVNAIRKQQQGPVQWGYYEVMVNDTLPSWKRFVQRRILPYVQEVTRVSMVWKKLVVD